MTRRFATALALSVASAVALLAVAITGWSQGGVSLAAGSATPEYAVPLLLIGAAFALTAAVIALSSPQARPRIAVTLAIFAAVVLAVSLLGVWHALNSPPVGDGVLPLGGPV